MSDIKAKMHPIRFRLGLRSRPRWGSLLRSPIPPSCITGGLLLRGGKGGKGKGDREGKGSGKRKGEGGRKGKGARKGNGGQGWEKKFRGPGEEKGKG